MSITTQPSEPHASAAEPNGTIRVRGARAHNLHEVDIDLPRDKMIVLTGPSGSGKSSLAFHTLYNESKRKFLNSMPDSFKFFSDRPLKADVDEITPVLPVFALSQHNPVMRARSAAIDALGMTEKLQKLFYILGVPTCPDHRVPFVVSPFAEHLRFELSSLRCAPQADWMQTIIN